jgi:hypothetical protein
MPLGPQSSNDQRGAASRFGDARLRRASGPAIVGRSQAILIGVAKRDAIALRHFHGRKGERLGNGAIRLSRRRRPTPAFDRSSVGSPKTLAAIGSRGLYTAGQETPEGSPGLGQWQS